MTKAVIFDLDGTLVDIAGLEEYVTGVNTDYDTFHKHVVAAPAVEFTLSLYDNLDPQLEVVIITARQEQYREATVDWLVQQDVEWNQLFMRRTGDLRSDYEVKREALKMLVADGYDIIQAVDDNPATVRLWLENGIPVTVIPGWPNGYGGMR